MRLGISRLLLATAVALPIAACHETVLLDPTHDGGGSGGVSSVGSGGSGGTSGTGGSGGAIVDASVDQASLNCQPLNLPNLGQHSAEVILSVDRSGAMAQPFGNFSGNRLNAVRTELSKIVASGYNKVVRFGYQEFPSPFDCPTPGDTCCAGSVTKPGPNTFMAFNNLMSSCDSSIDNCNSQKRPILDALSQCQTAFSSSGRKRFVLLMTAGEPNCSNSTGQQCNNTINEVGSLADTPTFITTYILKVGDDVVTSCLASLAQNGGGVPQSPTSPYYTALGPIDLDGAMTAILDNIAQNGCRFDLPANFGDPTKLQATIGNNSPLTSDMMNGFSIDSSSGNNQLVLHGAACGQLIDASNLTDLHVAACTASRH